MSHYVVWNDSQRLKFEYGSSRTRELALWMEGPRNYTKFTTYEQARNAVRMTRRYIARHGADWEALNGRFRIVREG